MQLLLRILLFFLLNLEKKRFDAENLLKIIDTNTYSAYETKQNA